MKFCQICGRPLNDGEVCNCQAQQAAPQQPQYQQAPYQQAPQQPYGAPAPRAAGEPAIVKALKNIPVAFLSFFKSSDKVVGTAKAKKDVILPALYCAIFFITNLLLGIVFFTRSKTPSYYKGLSILKYVFGGGSGHLNFGYALLGALIMTVVVCVLYTGTRFAAQVIFAKKPAMPALIDSFIEFGMNLIPVICFMILATLLGLATSWLIPPMLGLAAAYLVVTGVINTLKEAQGYQNKFVLTCFLSCSVMVTVALAFWMLFVVCCMAHTSTMYGVMEALMGGLAKYM